MACKIRMYSFYPQSNAASVSHFLHNALFLIQKQQNQGFLMFLIYSHIRIF